MAILLLATDIQAPPWVSLVVLLVSTVLSQIGTITGAFSDLRAQSRHLRHQKELLDQLKQWYEIETYRKQNALEKAQSGLPRFDFVEHKKTYPRPEKPFFQRMIIGGIGAIIPNAVFLLVFTITVDPRQKIVDNVSPLYFAGLALIFLLGGLTVALFAKRVTHPVTLLVLGIAVATVISFIANISTHQYSIGQ